MRNNRKKTKILFVYAPYLLSFIKTDLEILQRHFDVIPHHWTRTRDIKNILRVLWYILRTDLSFTWFAGGHATRVVFLSKFLGKRSIVVASGYSVADMPEINYGLMSFPESARRVKYVLDNADKVLAVSEFNKREIEKYTYSRNIELIYHGVNHNKYKPQGVKEKDLVITVGEVKKSNLSRKGLETFVRTAEFLPNTKFVLIGKQFDDSVRFLKSIASPNVEFAGFVSGKELVGYYQRAKVYVQLSAHEGFGCSLAEAMLCECVPVVTERGAIPEVVGDTGFYVPYDDPKVSAEAVDIALKSDKGKAARERIRNKFLIERREKELVRIIFELLGDDNYKHGKVTKFRK